MRLLKLRLSKLRTAVISVAVLALIATTAVVAVAQGETSDWQAVRGEAITRIGSEYMGAERDQVADSIANDVTSRGTVWRFMLGSDSGVLYGVGPSAVQSEVQVQTKATTRKVYVTSGHGPHFGNQSVGNVKAVVGNDVMITLPKPLRTDGWVAAYALSALPSGLSLPDVDDGQTASTITGSPAFTGSTTATWTATLTKTGETTFTDSLTFTITVVADTVPKLPSIGNETATVDVPFTLELPEAYGGNEPYVYTVTDEPAGLDFNGVTRILSGTPTGAATVTVSYTVTDVGVGTATEKFLIDVVDPS